jgi:anti-sigma regulatory factor (Ser/Thr protein kinase)
MSRTLQQAQWTAVPDDAVLLLHVCFDRHSVSTARGEVARCGRANGLGDRTLPNFVLAVNEITTNAARYAHGGRLRLWGHRNALWCEVTDNGTGIPQGHLDQSHRRRQGHVGGHGLWLARQICHSFEISTDHSGTGVLMGYFTEDRR